MKAAPERWSRKRATHFDQGSSIGADIMLIRIAKNPAQLDESLFMKWTSVLDHSTTSQAA
jgi:hypothetical protein